MPRPLEHDEGLPWVGERPDSVWRQLSWIPEEAGRALRVLRRNARLSLATVATLVVGIGANAATFGLVQRLLAAPLPFSDDERVVSVFQLDVAHGRKDKATGAVLSEWLARRDVFADVGYAWDTQYTLTGVDRPRTLRGYQFSANLFELLGARPALGRVFTPGDDRPGQDHVVVLSDQLWRSAFGARPDVIGRTIALSEEPYVVVGVMPPTFAHPDAAVDVWTPLTLPGDLAGNRTLHAFSVVGRLRPGASLGSVQARLSALARRDAREWPETDGHYGVSLEPIREALLPLDSADPPGAPARCAGARLSSRVAVGTIGLAAAGAEPAAFMPAGGQAQAAG